MTFVKRTDWANNAAGGTPIMAADMLRIEQGIANAAVVSDIATAGTATGDALRAALVGRASVTLSGSMTLKDGIAALPSTGGNVLIPEGRWPAGDWTYDTNYMSKPNVSIVGVRMPHLTANADRLDGGSVIEGRFNAFADGFEARDVGFDAGKYVIDTRYGGADTHTANHPLGGTWDAFAFAQPATPLAYRVGLRLHNVIGLNRDSQSVGHAVLIEGVDGGFTTGDVIGVAGVHALAIKCKNMKLGRLAGWAGSSNCVVFKSDTIAACGHLDIEAVEALTIPAGTTPWFTPAVASQGIHLNPESASFVGPVQIGRAKVFGSSLGLSIGGGAGLYVTDVQIGELLADTYTGALVSGIDFAGCRAQRIRIGAALINAAQQGISWAAATSDDAAEALSIGAAQFTNMGTRAVNASLYGRVRIDTLTVTNSPIGYYIEDTARVLVGKEALTGVTTKWERTPPALGTGWANFGGGNSTFEVKLSNYGVKLKGLIKAAAGATGTLASLPVYLRPPESQRLPGYVNNGSRNFALIGVDSATAGVTLNDGTAPATNDYVSLDGVDWQH